MGVIILLALLAAAAAGAGASDKKPAPSPAPKPTDGEMKPGDSKDTLPPGTKSNPTDIFPMDSPSDEVKLVTPSVPSVESLKGPAFTDLGSSLSKFYGANVKNPSKEMSDWPGIKSLAQPHRNLALNVVSDFIYKALSATGPVPLCWKGTCSKEAVDGARKAIEAAGGMNPAARSELWAVYYKLRDAGR